MIGINNINKAIIYFSDENKPNLIFCKNANNEVGITKQYINIIYLDNSMSKNMYNKICYDMNKKIKASQFGFNYMTNSNFDYISIKHIADFEFATCKLKNNKDRYLIYLNNQFDNDISINADYLDRENNVIMLDNENKIKNLYRIITLSKSIYKASFDNHEITNIAKLDFDKHIENI